MTLMKKFKILALLLMASLMFAGCSKEENKETSSTEQKTEEKTEEKKEEKTEEKTEENKEEAQEPTADNPMIVDEANKQIKVYAEVNDKFKNESTMHAIVAKSGKNNEQSMFVSYANQNDLYDALEKLGGKPGNNVTMDNMGKEAVKGDKIDLTFKFQGSDNEQGINDVIKDSSGKEFDIRFGGNQKPAKDMNTGCMTCLQSCPLGITSNANQLIGADEKDGVKYTLADSVPADKTPVVITYKLAN